MLELIKAHQLNLMLFLCGACGILIFLLMHTRFLSKNRKRILILMELVALLLLWFDRLAYLYAGVPGRTAFYMVRISNFAVFFLTSGIVFGFNLFLSDCLIQDVKPDSLPFILKLVQVLSVIGMVMAVFSAYTNLYYYFDETNKYHRGSGFLIAYIVPVICPILQYTVVRKYRKIFSRLIYVSLILYIFVPIACGILQVFTYGISIVNISMVLVSIGLYIFTYLDINDTVEHAHEIEIQNMQDLQQKVLKEFDRTIMGLVSEIEEKDGLDKGNAILSAEYARKIAEICEKDEEYCQKVYYATLFRSIGFSNAMDKVIDLKEDEAKDMQRIAEVSCDYVHMTTAGEDRNPIPDYLAREVLVREAGEKYDLAFANLMVKIIDAQDTGGFSDVSTVESEISCNKYRDHISNGIEITAAEKKICFECKNGSVSQEISGAPSIVLFDSIDRRVHNDEKIIREYDYLEYGEIWFDGHYVATAARKIKALGNVQKETADTVGSYKEKSSYEIRAVRFEDHIRIKMTGPEYSNEMIIALPDKTKSSYIGLTGEKCEISDIKIETEDEEIKADIIPRIVTETSYIDSLESDIKNVQIDRFRSAASEGIELTGKIRILFHSMSLPSANMIWHCPSVVIYYSKDGNVFGPEYREYDLIKLNGEEDGDKEYVTNRFKMKRKEEFPGWELWKEINKAGLDYEVSVYKKGNRITVKTINLGIELENTTTVMDDPDKVYVALTGDQVALTDIRLK